MLRQRTLLISLALGATPLFAFAAEPELSLTLSAHSPETYLAEPLPLKVEVRNVSDHDVRLPITWEEGYFSGTMSRDGEPRSWSFQSGDYIPRHLVLTLRPGQSYVRWTELTEITMYQRLGTYELRGKLESNGLAPDRVKKKLIPCWKGAVSAKPLRITVKKPPTKADRQALEALARRYISVERIAHFADLWLKLHGARARFQAVLEKYPRSVYAPYCRLHLAEIWAEEYDGVGPGYRKGLEHVRALLAMRPKFRLADQAELTLARLYLEEAQVSHTASPEERGALRRKAVSHLEHVVRAYPTRRSAEVANRLLKKQRQSTRPSGALPRSQSAADTGRAGQAALAEAGGVAGAALRALLRDGRDATDAPSWAPEDPQALAGARGRLQPGAADAEAVRHWQAAAGPGRPAGRYFGRFGRPRARSGGDWGAEGPPETNLDLPDRAIRGNRPGGCRLISVAQKTHSSTGC